MPLNLIEGFAGPPYIEFKALTIPISTNLKSSTYQKNAPVINFKKKLKINCAQEETHWKLPLSPSPKKRQQNKTKELLQYKSIRFWAELVSFFFSFFFLQASLGLTSWFQEDWG